MHVIADIKERFSYFSDLEVNETEKVLKGQRGLRSRRSSDFKLYISTVLNDLDKWAVISPMLDHSKITKMPF